MRSMALSRPLEITEVDAGIVASKAAVEREIETAERRIDNMKKDQGFSKLRLQCDEEE